MKIIAIKKDGVNSYSVCIETKKLNIWIDVYYNKHNELNIAYNQYIFDLKNSVDIAKKKFQDNSQNFIKINNLIERHLDLIKNCYNLAIDNNINYEIQQFIKSKLFRQLCNYNIVNCYDNKIEIKTDITEQNEQSLYTIEIYRNINKFVVYKISVNYKPLLVQGTNSDLRQIAKMYNLIF